MRLSCIRKPNVRRYFNMGKIIRKLIIERLNILSFYQKNIGFKKYHALYE